MPEILPAIFSFLNQYTLKNSVRYVCRQWLALARPLIRVHALWGELDHHDALLAYLFHVTDLRVAFQGQWDPDTLLCYWNKLSDKLNSLKEKDQLIISNLTILNTTCLTEIIYPMLHKINTLTKIHIIRVSESRIHIGTILSLCPKLLELHIDHGFYGGYHWVEDDTIPSWPGATSVCQESAIERLIIRGMHIEQKVIERILERCRRIRVLKLLRVNYIGQQQQQHQQQQQQQQHQLGQQQGQEQELQHLQQLQQQDLCFNRASFYITVAKSCPMLKQFHLSMFDEHMSIEDAQNLIRTFYPGVQSEISVQDEQEHHDPEQIINRPLLNTVSVLDRDINRDTSHILLAPLLNASFNNIITTLEVTPSKYRSHNAYFSNTLHSFLCSAPSLLHLLAPKAPYFAEYLDLSGHKSDNGPNNPRDHAPGNDSIPAPRGTKTEIWACRGLLTLQMMFVSRNSKDEPSAENARMMFGYISTVCPNLRELEIDREELDLKLDGGFCLLTRLRFLESLSIITWTTTKLETRDIDWMARYPSGTFGSWFKCKSNTRSKQGSSQAANQLNSHDNERLGVNWSSRDVLTVDHVVYAGSMSNLKECREHISQGMGHMGCLPMLDKLRLQVRLMHKGDIVISNQHLPAMIASVRPDVEFFC
ncbi:hypothetical protein BGX26_009951 [Mortierella sp. AD094]|nr:hypothetical protein BGX26_009951 [Mortierella sp. AD094]